MTDKGGVSAGLMASLAIAMGIGPLLVYGLTAMSPSIIDDLDLTRAQFGVFATAAFITAAICSTVFGALVDRWSVARTMVVLYAGAVASLVVAALARSIVWLVAAVVISGAIQALSNPVTNRLVASHAAPDSRGTLVGVKQSGVQMAQALAGLAMPPLALLVTWRGSLAAGTVVALAGLALTLRYLPRTEADGRSASTSGTSVTLGAIPGVVWWLAGYAMLNGVAIQATNVYLPLYGYEELGISRTVAGMLATVVGAVGLVARIWWGRTVGRAESPRISLIVLAVGATLGVGVVLLADYTANGLVWVGAALFGASGIAANVVLMVTVVRAVAPRLVGRATGVLSLGLYLGFSIGPVSFGALVDATSYPVGWVCVLVVYALTVVLAVSRRRFLPKPA
ncbi:MFS transporter [Actinomycetales bacterium JB111]|nr:MFS transporter [Actinomycetales bacterium JB111]